MDIFSRDQPFIFGDERIRGGGRFGPIHHEHLDLSIGLSGKANICVDGIEHQIDAGYALFVYSEHVYEANYPRGVERHCIFCHTGEITVPMDFKNQLKSMPILLKPSALLSTLLNEGIRLGHSNSINVSRLRNSLGIAAYNEYFRLAHLKNEESSYPRAVLAAKRYLDVHYAEPCKLELVASKARVNARYLISLFKRHLGVTPIRYLWQLRGERGIHLLKRTGMPVNEIAYDCGFRTSHHFSRYIKEHYGHTPSDIRTNDWRSAPTKPRTVGLVSN